MEHFSQAGGQALVCFMFCFILMDFWLVVCCEIVGF